jgi:NhaP-type Na+/H+ or K+/H+ antiporter
MSSVTMGLIIFIFLLAGCVMYFVAPKEFKDYTVLYIFTSAVIGIVLGSLLGLIYKQWNKEQNSKNTDKAQLRS